MGTKSRLFLALLGISLFGCTSNFSPRAITVWEHNRLPYNEDACEPYLRLVRIVEMDQARLNRRCRARVCGCSTIDRMGPVVFLLEGLPDPDAILLHEFWHHLNFCNKFDWDIEHSTFKGIPGCPKLTVPKP